MEKNEAWAANTKKNIKRIISELWNQGIYEIGKAIIKK